MNETTSSIIRRYDLGAMLFSNSIAALRMRIIKIPEAEFPKRIGDYYYVRRFKKVGPRKTYPLAIYRNKEGKQAIAKMKSARVKGASYFSLVNETILYRTINNALKRQGGNIPEKFKKIYIPKLLAVVQNDDVLLSLVEYVEGNVAETLSSEDKITLYFLMVAFLQYIGGTFTEEEKRQLSQRTPYDYLLLYPLLVVKAMITYPHAVPAILRSIPAFIKRIRVMVTDSQVGLVHRDLHFMNIICLKDGYALIDFQQAVFTEPLHEVITTLRYWWKGWKNEEFGQLLMKEIVRQYGNRKHFTDLFQVYAINSVTHGLTGAGFSNKIINGWIDFLRFATKPDFKKYE